jgi:hypothetical protein
VPHGNTLVGLLFYYGLVGRVGMAHQQRLGVAPERPPGL